MNKTGSVLKVMGIIFIILLTISLITGIYFYNFYTFKTVRVCIGNATNTMIPCKTNQDCINIIKSEMQKTNLTNAPKFVKEKINSVINESAYCKTTCFVKNIRGINLKTKKLEMINSCNAQESEITAKINGKRGIEILMWLKKEKGLNFV